MSLVVTEAFELVTLKSGVKSLRLTDTMETFHPVIGPVAEASILHVKQQRLVERCAQPGRFVIWDVGLGAAANALCAIDALHDAAAEVEIHSFDRTLAPLLFAMQHAAALEYLLPYRQALESLVEKRHVRLRDGLTWHLHLGDFREEMQRRELPAPQAVFYDPYSVKGNREMWTLEHFQSLRRRIGEGAPCLLTNYTRSTVVRVTWLLAGFYVGAGTGIGEKSQTSIASNQLDALARPFDFAWCERIRTSHTSTPIRANDNSDELAPMSASDYAALLNHPQFAARS